MTKLSKLIASVTIVFISIFLAACTPPVQQGYSTDTLQGLLALSDSNNQPAGTQPNSIRLNAIQETALSVGARAGLSWRAKQIDAVLQDNTRHLNQLYNFNAMLLDHDVLPPVLAEGNAVLNLASPDTIRIADRTYKIISQARFVTAAPTWRQYLWMDYSPPEAPDRTLLPKTDEEQQIWDAYIKQGWQDGIKQANQIFQANLNRLTRDYNGMALYRKLLAQNIISKPYVAKTNLGITGGGNSMSINDQVLRITALPQLNANSSAWKPVIATKEQPEEKIVSKTPFLMTKGQS